MSRAEQMKQLYLDALRDIAIEHIPKAQAALLQAKGRPKDYLCLSLYGTTVSVLATAATPAKEQAAARLLQYVMQLSFSGDDNKLTAVERKRVEGYAIAAAHELCTLTERTIPWLPAALAEAPEPEAPPAPTIQAAPQITLPPPGINLTTQEAARLLNRADQTLRGWASKDSGPLRPIRCGTKRLAWSSDDIRKLIEKGW